MSGIFGDAGSSPSPRRRRCTWRRSVVVGEEHIGHHPIPEEEGCDGHDGVYKVDSDSGKKVVRYPKELEPLLPGLRDGDDDLAAGGGGGQGQHLLMD